MAMSIRNIEVDKEDWLIPLWVKFAVTIFALSTGTIFVLALLSVQEALFGISTGLISVLSLGFMLFSLAVAASFWFVPNHPLPISIYWLMRFFKELLCVFALLGMVTLLTIKIPLASMRGGIPFIDLLLLFLVGLFLQPVKMDYFPLRWMERFFAFWKKVVQKINSVPAWIPGIIVALLPILIICSVIYLGLGARLSDYGPKSFWNDEVSYWVWVRSFSQTGFNAGYNAPNELLARAPFNHYGEGSPLYVYLYGAIGQLTGWLPQLPLLINFVLLAFAIFFFVRATKLEPVQIIFVGLITVLTWPVLLYLPMTTHETLNQAIGFILAIIFFRFLTNREGIGLPARIFFVFLVFLAALVRLSWGLFLVPVLFYSLNGGVLRRVLLSIVLGAGLYILAVLITNYLVPPVNNSIFLNVKGSLTEGPRVLIDYIAFQLKRMFKSRQLNPNIAILLQILIILGWNMGRVVRMIRSRFSAESVLQSRAVFDMYNVASLTAAGFLFYIQEAFYRTFTPSLLIVYLLQAAKKDYRMLLSLLAINVLFFYSYMTFYAHTGDAAIIKADFVRASPKDAQVQAEIARWIKFDETTQNPWCNTLLIPLHFYDYRLTIIPPGIGISYILDMENMQTPVKSKYLLMDPGALDLFGDRLNISLLGSFSVGDLYYNQDSGCKLTQ
jgi:hypothetical protein